MEVKKLETPEHIEELIAQNRMILEMNCALIKLWSQPPYCVKDELSTMFKDMEL